MNRTLANVSVTLALASLLLGACAQPPAADTRPNIVFVLLDDVRWDDLGAAGHPFVQTPNFDRVAHEGVLFRNTFAATPLCSPNRASILTGQYAHTHGIIDNVDRSEQSHRLVTFPRLMHDAGYERGIVVAAAQPTAEASAHRRATVPVANSALQNPVEERRPFLLGAVCVALYEL